SAGQVVRRQPGRHVEPFTDHPGSKPRRVVRTRTADRRKEGTGVSATPTFAVWLDLVLGLGLGSAAVVVLAALLSRKVSSAGWQRTIWQVCALGLALVLLGEGTGVSREIDGWIRGRKGDGSAGASEQPAGIGVSPSSAGPLATAPASGFTLSP